MIDTLGHYKILEQLGAGGLGDVFRARDTVLGRTVLIKVLPAQIAADPERRERFLQAARAASTLSHPSIATLFEIGEDKSHLFLVFEFVTGQTLSHVIGGRALSLRRAVDLGTQLADALAEAHTRGVVHGDIKPDNIRVTPKERAKVLDFGLSAWTGGGAIRDAAPAQSETSPAHLLGTVAYVSPEQALGKPVDHRTDLFSLGIVLFEMVTGRASFAEGTASATVLRIVQGTPVAPSSVNPSVPPELDAVVLRALSKDLNDRYQSAASLAAELRSVGAILDIRSREREPPAVIQAPPGARTRWRRLATVVVLAVLGGAATWRWQDEGRWLWRRWLGPPVSPVIAVIPLEVANGEPTYFGDGLTEDLVTRLGQIPGLQVVGRSSIRAHRGMDPRVVAQQLNAGVVLSGSVRPEGEQIGVTVELVEPDEGIQLWTERYANDLGRVFAIQTEIAEEVARELRVDLAPSAARARKKSHVVSTGAYDLYLRGRDAAARGDLAQAIELYGRAIARDEGFAEVYAALAEALHVGVVHGRHAGGPETDARLEQAAANAAAVDPDLPQTQLAQGLAAATLEDALTHLRRAVELDPSYAEGYHHIGDQIIELDPLLAIRFFQRSLELDPGLGVSRLDTVAAYALLDQFEEADRQVERGRAVEPDGIWWDGARAQLLFEQQRYEAGIPLVEESSFGILPMRSVVYATALRMSGRSTEARAVADETAETFPSFCEGRAAVAALRFEAGRRTAARRIANSIFEAAGQPNASPSVTRCAAMAAAAIRNVGETAKWLQQIADNEAALRAWTLRVNGISGRTLLRRRWFPWDRIADRRPVADATQQIEEAVGALKAEALQALDGLPE